MNRNQAKEALNKGKNLTHPFFDERVVEYIFQKKGESTRVYFDDGSYVTQYKFWEFKQTENWNRNWEIVN